MIIAFINLKGGVGKSTLCINIAGVLASQGKRVLIIDLDPQQTAFSWNKTRSKNTQQDLFSIRVHSSDVAKNWPSRNRLKNIMAEYKFDCCLLDGAASMTHISSAALNICDLAVLPMRPSKPDFDGTVRTVKFINKPPARVKRIPDWVVLQNNVNSRTNIAKHYATEILPSTWGSNVLPSQIGDRVAYQQAMEDGITVTESKPNGPEAKEIGVATNAIITRVNGRLS